MKGLKIYLFLALLLAAFAPAGWAQDGSGAPRGIQRLQQELELSDEQTGRLREIFKTHRESRKQSLNILEHEIKSILTPQQLQHYNTLKASRSQARGKTRRHGLQDMIVQLSLTPQQAVRVTGYVQACAQEMRAARAQFMAQVESVLTPQQFQRFQAILRARLQSRGGGQGFFHTCEQSVN